MGSLKNKIVLLSDIVSRTAELFQDTEVKESSRSGQFRMYLGSGDLVTIILDLEDNQNATGIHGNFEDLDEYELSDLVEQAARGGYEKIYLHLRGAS